MTQAIAERLYGRKYRRRWWSVLNWLRGHKYDPVGRCRHCDHTSPTHYRHCRTQPTVDL